MLLSAIAGSTALVYFGAYVPPEAFPMRTLVTIPEGVTLTEAADILAQEHIIRSTIAFRIVMHTFGNNAAVQAGEYYFDHPISLTAVTDRLLRGAFGLEPVRITIPEGATTYQMADLLARKFTAFDPDEFMLRTTDKEGYLYPDTYSFPPNTSTAQVLEVLERTFYEKIRSVETLIAQSGKPVHEIITMASLLEKEASDPIERREIAGVLWHRIEIDMPLQVDAVFGYIEQTDTFSPKYSDLETDSPYNTYKYKGLPPGPIGSPSLSSIEAAADPIPTNALYYLHGRDGMLHIARSFEEHVLNRRRYLD